MKIVNTFLCILVMLFGLILVIGGLGTVHDKVSLVNKSVKTNGQVIASKVVEDGYDSSTHRTRYKTISTISFVNKEGGSIQFQDNITSHIPNIGDKINILYDPQNPQAAVIDDGVYLWFSSVMMLFCGLILVISGGFGIRRLWSPKKLVVQQ